jgi:quercetin dioxygenase-like cupin family protein
MYSFFCVEDDMSIKLKDRIESDPVMRPIASYKTLLDDEKTCITLFTIKPGEQTGWHRHEYDYVALQQSEGRLHLDYADGTSLDIDYSPGKALPVKAPVEHNAINVGDVDIIALEIEYKAG